MNSVRFLLFSLCCLGDILAISTTSIPLSFEQRDSGLFVTHAAGDSVQFRMGSVTVGGVTLLFRNSSAAARLEGIGAASPATYVSDCDRCTFQQFPKLAMRSLYPGIDAVFYGNAGRLEYDLALAPGASPARVRLAFENARHLTLDTDGTLVIEGPSGTIRQLPPRVFQAQRQIPARYKLISANQVEIHLGRYDRHQALTIDPVLVYAKYFGGSGSDSANVVATDAQGNVYVAGHSNSLDFPGVNGASAGPLPPLIALSDNGQTIARLPIGSGNSVTAIGGTPDGKILYAAAAGAIYYSSDGGVTLRPGGPLPVPIFSLLQSNVTVNDISLDPIDPTRVYVATNRGLFGSGNSGQSWFPCDYNLAASADGSINVASVSVSPADHLLLYATTSQPKNIYKSTDAGATWQILYPAYPGEPAPGPYSTSQIIFTIAPNGTDLYVIDSYSILFKSSDAGATWQARKDTLFNAKSVRVDPANPSNIFVLDNAGLLKSTDAGLTFTNIDPAGVQGFSVTAFTYDGVTHTLYLAASGSIYASPDQGVTWQTAPALFANVYVLTALGGRVFAGIDSPQTTFLLKLDPNGQSLYSTFFSGPPLDYILAMKVDSQGSAYLAGGTYSQALNGVINLSPPAPPSYTTGFLAKVAADGSKLEWVSTIGGSRGTFIQGLAIDSTGAAYITGSTPSPDFPTTPNAFQTKTPTTACTRPPGNSLSTPGLNSGTWGFAAKVAPDGKSLSYSTFLGGSCGSSGQSIAVNAAGEAFLGGYTTSPDMAVSTGAYQGKFPGPVDTTVFPNALSAGYVVKLSADGEQALNGTYIGGGYNTLVNAIALDASGNPVMTGSTWGIAPGATPGAYQSAIVYQCSEFSIGPAHPPSNGADAFVLKLDPALSKALYLTYLGGVCFDGGNSVAIDPAGNVWVGGATGSADFPLNSPFQTAPSSGFISELSPDASKLLFSSLSDGSALAIDPKGTVYAAGYRYTGSSAQSDVFLARIDPSPSPAIVLNRVPQNIAPGELIKIEGHNLAPATEVDAKMDSTGSLPFTLANTRVMFDGFPAPLLSVQDGVIQCFVPFEVSQSTQVTVESNGQKSNTVRASVVSFAAVILAVVNQDGTLNTADNPAAQGSAITVYVTGLGQTSPASVDGKINTSSAPKPLAPVSASVNGSVSAPVEFVGSAPGLVAGITQVNVRIPVAKYPANPNSITVNFATAPLFLK
jgi:uncharacterized protein (TIGR03437 family)